MLTEGGQREAACAERHAGAYHRAGMGGRAAEL